MMAIFFTTIDDKQPKQQGMDSLIKGNPGKSPFKGLESTSYTSYELGKLARILSDPHLEGDTLAERYHIIYVYFHACCCTKTITEFSTIV